MHKTTKTAAPKPTTTPAQRRKIPASFWTDRAAKIAASRAANEKAGMTERQRRAQRKAEREALAAAQTAPKKGAASPPRAPRRSVKARADAARPVSPSPKATPVPARRGRTRPPHRSRRGRPLPPPRSRPHRRRRIGTRRSSSPAGRPARTALVGARRHPHEAVSCLWWRAATAHRRRHRHDVGGATARRDAVSRAAAPARGRRLLLGL